MYKVGNREFTDEGIEMIDIGNLESKPYDYRWQSRKRCKQSIMVEDGWSIENTYFEWGGED